MINPTDFTAQIKRLIVENLILQFGVKPIVDHQPVMVARTV